MSKISPKRVFKNEEGFVLVATLFILVIITLMGIFAITNSNTELAVVRNEQQLTLEFYNAETGLIDSMENSNLWMTSPFLAAGTGASTTVNSTLTHPDGTPIATIEVRCIASTALDTPLSPDADNLPLQSHVAPPPSGSGYGMKHFEIRRYGLTSTSTNGRTVVQGGVWKIFNKY
ncbi:MAG: hypothetical protein A2V65_07855 [Deltaproteobacteria bacterium RBG_13_49_15]|nr:MAG: hypothetical protein A2V65_07855 [Deltaproteobacteria bacterium RBG_13_49_15]